MIKHNDVNSDSLPERIELSPGLLSVSLLNY